MILEMKKWCEGIIVAVFLCIIIESLIPNGNNKKYIKVIIGIYIMYVSLNPILNLLNYNFDFKIFEKYAQTEEVSSLPERDIKNIYLLGIEQSIKNELEEIGYEINKVKVFVDLNYENIEKIELEIKNNTLKNENQIVNQAMINNKNCITSCDDMLDYISENYFVKRENIIIK